MRRCFIEIGLFDSKLHDAIWILNSLCYVLSQELEVQVSWRPEFYPLAFKKEDISHMGFLPLKSFSDYLDTPAYGWQWWDTTIFETGGYLLATRLTALSPAVSPKSHVIWLHHTWVRSGYLILGRPECVHRNFGWASGGKERRKGTESLVPSQMPSLVKAFPETQIGIAPLSHPQRTLPASPQLCYT